MAPTHALNPIKETLRLKKDHFRELKCSHAESRTTLPVSDDSSKQEADFTITHPVHKEEVVLSSYPSQEPRLPLHLSPSVSELTSLFINRAN